MAYAQAVAASSAGSANVNVAGPGSDVFDGLTVTAGQRVLLTNQTTPSENGVWIFHGTGVSMKRPTGTDQYKRLNILDNATVIWVTGGATRAGTVWGLDAAKIVTVGTTPHNLTRVSLPPVQARAATVDNINLASPLTTPLDGVTLVGDGRAGSDVVLVKDQTTASENGLYWANSAGAMPRCSEPIPAARTVLVSEGDRNVHTEWVCNAQGAIVLGKTNLPFVRKDANYGKTVVDMLDADQAAPTGDGIVEAISSIKLTAAHKLSFPAPSEAATSYRKTVHNACIGRKLIVGTSAAARAFSIPPGSTSIVEFDENGACELVGKVYDPRDFGCPWDGIHDDLPGLNAMMAAINEAFDANGLIDHSPAHIQLPRGKGYCSDSWHINHPVHVIGHGWGVDDTLSELANGIRFAPLRAGIIVDSAVTLVDGHGIPGAGSNFRDLSLTSTQAIVTNPSGAAGRQYRTLGTTEDERKADTYYELGACILKDRATTTHRDPDPTFCEGATRNDETVVMFRCTMAGHTLPMSATPGLIKDATLANLGDVINDDGTLQWTVESVPKDYVNSSAFEYQVGQRVFLPGDPSCYFECIEKGRSWPKTTLDVGLDVGLGVTVPRRLTPERGMSPMISPTYGGEFYDDVDAGAGLKWKTYFPMGFLFLASNCIVQHCSVAGFTGAAFYATGGVVQDDPIPTAGYFTTIRDCAVMHCGGGVKFVGGAANGCLVDLLLVDKVGIGRTNVDAPDYQNLPPTWGTGAYACWDASPGGGSFRHVYGQAFLGAPFRNDHEDIEGKQVGSSSLWLWCLAEVGGQQSHFWGSPVVIQCYPVPKSGQGLQGVIIGDECRGLNFVDRTGANELTAVICLGGVGLYEFHSDEDASYYWGWNYAGRYWGLKYGAAQPNAFTLTGKPTGTSPGLGWLAFNRGHFIGDTDQLLYRGPLASTDRPVGRIQDRQIRAGLRKAGDRFEGATATVTITGEGYRAYPWDEGIQVSVANEADGVPAYMAEPRANGDFPAAGRNVFKVVAVTRDDARTGAVEPPAWAGPINPSTMLPWAQGDQVIEEEVTWEWVGTTPPAVVTRGLGGGQSVNAADLSGRGTATPVILTLPESTELTLDDNRSYSVRVRILGSKLGAQAFAHDVHELLVHATAGTLTIDDDTVIATKNIPGWTLAVSAPAGLTLRVACDPGADTVDFVARLEWTSLAGA